MRLALFVLALPLFACGGSESEAAETFGMDLGAAGAALGPGMERSSDPRVQRLREAIGLGRGDLAAGLMDAAIELDLGVEAPLLKARQAALLGDDVEAARWIEQARASAADDPRVYAAASEIATAGGRLGLAQQELEAGLRRCGAGPELLRARGVLNISTPNDLGAARRGLADLQAARAADPELPFLDWPQSEAHRLVGQVSRGSDPKGAEEHLRASLALDPGNRYAAEALGELLVSEGDFDGGLEILNGLIADGLPLHAKVAGLEHGAGMLCLATGDREGCAEHILRARELGMPDDQLGTGLSVLSSMTLELLEQGRGALDGGDLARAEALFERAVRYSPDYEPAQESLGMVQAMGLIEAGAELQAKGDHAGAVEILQRAVEADPQSLQARVFLGASQFELGHYTRASETWGWVVQTARAEQLEFPEPLHIKLAQALLQAGDGGGAREVLAGYLESFPEGRWVKHTHDYTAKLEAIEGTR